MMMLGIARHEFRYMFCSLQSLIVAAIFFGLSFLFTANGIEFQSTARGGSVFINSPYIITKFLIMMSILAVFITPAYIANAILKDHASNFDAILFSTPIDKSAYLLGRFGGAFFTLLAVVAMAPLGLYLGTYWPWAVAETLTSNNIATYIKAFVIFVIPSLFTASAIIFAIAIISRSQLYSYFATLALIMLFIAVDTSNTLPAIWDPFMGEIFAQQTRYWTALERNSHFLAFTGEMVSNRLLWLGISLTIFVIAYCQFTFKKSIKVKKSNPKELANEQRLKAQVDVTFKSAPQLGLSMQVQQLFYRTRFEVRNVILSKPFILLMGFSFFILFFAITGRETLYDVKTYPLTRFMLSAIAGALTFSLMAILAFYSAEIIWRERQSKFNEIIDALPTPNWVFVTSKLAALILVMFAIVLLGTLMAISLQVGSGYEQLQLDRYLFRGLFYYPISYVYIAILACLLQVIAKSRMLGMLFFAVFIGVIVLAKDIFGIEHVLLSYGIAGIAAPLSDMNYNDRFATGGIWLRIYWGAIASALLILTYALWNRGLMQPLTYRLRNARVVMHTSVVYLGLGLFVIGTGSAGVIFYNTNVLNAYRTADDIEQLKLNYEQQYRQYQQLPMPKIVDVNIDVDIYPALRRIEARSTQILQNKTNKEINSIHLSFASDATVTNMSIDQAHLRSRDDGLGYYMFDLDKPMLPNETRTMTFDVTIQKQGFRNSRPDIKLVRNGSFITNNHLTPYIGFNPDIINKEEDVRRRLGLDSLPPIAELDDKQAHYKNGLRHDSDFINFETTVSTRLDQTAVSPGYLQKEWVKDNRRYFHYKMDKPMMNFYSFLSAEYQVAQDQWQGVDIQVLYHPTHKYNVNRMIDSVKDSLSYFGTAFSPYQYRQVRILEFPAYRDIAQAFPATIPFSENIGFVADLSDENEFDMPYYVTAHEMAHQWWGYQVMAANVQGGTMLIETLSQYSALLVMEKKYGRHHIRRFLKLELDKYLSGRVHDKEGENPLYKVGDQPYIHYRKGALVMYALKDYLGEDKVNEAIRLLIKNHAYRSKPYAISTDLIGYLKQVSTAEQHAIVEDLFENITLFDLKLVAADVTPLENGQYAVTIEVATDKYYEDASGNQTLACLELPIDIGLFVTNPDDKHFKDTDVIQLKKHRLTSGHGTIEIIVDRLPMYVGIDPYHKLIDRNTDDNIVQVEERTVEERLTLASSERKLDLNQLQ